MSKARLVYLMVEDLGLQFSGRNGNEKNDLRCCPERSDAFREWHGHKRLGKWGTCYGDADARGFALSGADFCFKIFRREN